MQESTARPSANHIGVDPAAIAILVSGHALDSSATDAKSWTRPLTGTEAAIRGGSDMTRVVMPVSPSSERVSPVCELMSPDFEGMSTQRGQSRAGHWGGLPFVVQPLTQPPGPEPELNPLGGRDGRPNAPFPLSSRTPPGET